MFTWWIEKNFGLNIVCLRAKTKTQLSPGGHDGWLSVNDINLSADIHTFHVATYQRGTKMQEIELCIDSEIEEILKASPEQEEKEKEGMYKLNKPKNKLKNIHSKTLVGTDGTQETILIKDVKKYKMLLKKNDRLTADVRDQIKKVTKDNHILKKQIENNTKREETERKQLEGEKQALLKTSRGLNKEVEQKNNKAISNNRCTEKSREELEQKRQVDALILNLKTELANVKTEREEIQTNLGEEVRTWKNNHTRVCQLKEDEVRELKEENSALLREKGKRGRNKRDSRLRLQRDKELEGTFQILLEESQKEILNLESERDSHKTAADKYRAEREKVKLAVEEQKIIQETLKSEYEQKASDALYQITTLTNTLKQSEEQNHKLLEENNKLKRELTRNKYPNIKSDNNNSTEGNIVNSGVISTYPPILSQGSQNEHSPSYHKISSLITSVQGTDLRILTIIV
ncbi:hypothetical protein LOD99_14487 [Oopsacas minuta]|uniref:Uncharacterized protein n=1 Tax=Oopsacas minuta TaxID=111878 RepID=A0AAV7KEN1_9METZ|nr:hypothetical protein LOD99_14487 [Oopsacas minuta]